MKRNWSTYLVPEEPDRVELSCPIAAITGQKRLDLIIMRLACFGQRKVNKIKKTKTNETKLNTLCVVRSLQSWDT